MIKGVDLGIKNVVFKMVVLDIVVRVERRFEVFNRV